VVAFLGLINRHYVAVAQDGKLRWVLGYVQNKPKKLPIAIPASPLWVVAESKNMLLDSISGDRNSFVQLLHNAVINQKNGLS
jgi:hypothetical protein